MVSKALSEKRNVALCWEDFTVGLRGRLSSPLRKTGKKKRRRRVNSCQNGGSLFCNTLYNTQENTVLDLSPKHTVQACYKGNSATEGLKQETL